MSNEELHQKIQEADREYEETKAATIEKIKNFFLTTTPENQSLLAEDLLAYFEEYGSRCEDQKEYQDMMKDF